MPMPCALKPIEVLGGLTVESITAMTNAIHGAASDSQTRMTEQRTAALPLWWPPPGPGPYLHCICALADELQRPVEEITSLYHADLMRIAPRAVVFDYLPVIVCRHLRGLYRRPHQTYSSDSVVTR
jgi:hypothetical protein